MLSERDAMKRESAIVLEAAMADEQLAAACAQPLIRLSREVGIPARLRELDEQGRPGDGHPA
jgi:hypothetical protein